MVKEDTLTKKKNKISLKVDKSKKTTKQAPNAIRKIKLKLTVEDKAIINNWFGCVRKTYNWALSCIKKKPKVYKINKIWLRKKFVNADIIPKKMKYLLDCPKAIRDGALDDLVGAYKINYEKRRLNPYFKFDVKYRSKRDEQSLYIDYSTVKFNGWENEEFKMFPTFLKSSILFNTRSRDKIPEKPIRDCRLVKNKLGNYYLHIPICTVRIDNQDSNKVNRWCGIDPGARTMMTVYSPEPGYCYKIGDKDIGRIIRLCLCIDKLISKLSTIKNKKKRKLELAIERIRLKLKHIVDEVHWKSINFLLNNFSTILLPTYNTSQMVKKSTRKIGSKSVRMMLGWRFYEFKTRLLQKATERNVSVISCTEEYTSKTCTNCHNIKYNLGANKTYKCTNCNITYDRDIGAARNIFLKNTCCKFE